MITSLNFFLDYIASKPTSWKVLIFAAENRTDHDEVLNIFDDPEFTRDDRKDQINRLPYYQGMALLYFPELTAW